MKKNLNLFFCFFLLSVFISSIMCVPASAAGRKSKVINDEWEEGWEETFFEKESKKKQILKKGKDRPSPRLRKAPAERNPAPQTLYKVEKPAPEPEPEEEAVIPQKIAVRNEYIEHSRAAEISAKYASLKFFSGTVEYGADFDSKGIELDMGFKQNALRFDIALMNNFKADELNGQSEMQAKAVLLNMYADFRIPGTPALIPYAGLGFGIANVNIKNNGQKGNGTDMAWQASAGLSYFFNENMALDSGIRLINYGSSRINGIDYAFEAKQFMLGVKAFF